MSYQKSWTAYEIAVKKSTSAKKYEPNISILWDSDGQLKKMAQNTCFYEGKIGPFWPIFEPSGHKGPRVPGTPYSKFMLILTLDQLTLIGAVHFLAFISIGALPRVPRGTWHIFWCLRWPSWRCWTQPERRRRWRRRWRRWRCRQRRRSPINVTQPVPRGTAPRGASIEIKAIKCSASIKDRPSRALFWLHFTFWNLSCILCFCDYLCGPP